MTYRHFSVAFSAIQASMIDSHGLRWVTHVFAALSFAALPARQPRMPRQSVDAVARRPAPRTGDGNRAAGARPAFRAADRGGRALRGARARHPRTLAAPAA